MTNGSIYLIAKDFEKSLEFYEKILEIPVLGKNMDRFAIFNLNGFCLNIMNGFFDKENPEKVIREGRYYPEYDDLDEIAKAPNSGKCVINLSTEDLQKEHDRILELGITKNLTEIRYINARNPYYYFSCKDPDDNIIEVTGNMKKAEE